MSDRARRIANLSPEKRRLLESMLQERAQGRTDEGIPTLPRYSESGQPRVFPLSSAQRLMWFNQQRSRGAHKLPPQATRLRGPLDVTALEASLHEVCTRHEALRTTFGTCNGEPVQIVGPPRPVPLTRVDLRELPPEAREADVSRLIVRESRRPFDLSRDLMLRATLMRLDDEEHVLLLMMPHIASDGESVGVLFGELSALYNAVRAGRRANLPELPVQYVDYVVWQWQRLRDGELQRLMDYWKDQLADAPGALHMPAGQRPLWLRTWRRARQDLRMPPWLLQELRVLCRRQNVTLFMTLLAAWATLLHRYSGEGDILIGTYTANRNRHEVERLIGCFSTLFLVLRHDLSGDPSFTELLKWVRETALDAFSHSELPEEILVKELYVDCDIRFTLQTTSLSSLELDGLQVERIKTDRGGSTPFLKLTMIQGDEDLTARLDYNSNIFEAATIQRMLGDLQSLLPGIVADPGQRISGLALLTEAEQLAPAGAQRSGSPVHPAQARNRSIRFRKRLRWSLRHARRGAGGFVRAGQAWPLVGSLLARIERVFGRLLPPMTLTEPFRVPSAGLLRDVPRRESGEPSRASLVAIRRPGSRPAFFGVSGNGDALCFRALAQRLGPDQPFYGFQPRDQDGGRTSLLEIENIAANCVREVHALQPEGPYFLGGHSSGGLVAFEMARQLRSQGRDVALLALFDTELRAKVPFQRRLRFQPRRKRREGPLGYVRRVTKSILWTIACGVWLRFGYSLPPRLSSTAFARARAATSYKAQSYPGRVTLFRATEPREKGGRCPHLGWDGVAAGGVEVYEVPGDHFTLLEEPHVQILAAQLKGCLDQTQADSSSGK